MVALLMASGHATSATTPTDSVLVFSAWYRQQVRAPHANPQKALTVEEGSPLVVDQNYAIRLQLVQLPESSGTRLYTGRIAFDTVEIAQNGEPDQARTRLLQSAAATPFLLALSTVGAIDGIGFAPSSAPGFITIVKELMATIVVPTAGRAKTWTALQPFPDGEYEVRYSRVLDAPDCEFQRTQKKPGRGSPVRDSVVADRQRLCLRQGDPFVVSLETSRSFHQTIGDKSIAQIEKSVKVTRGLAFYFRPVEMRETAEAARSRMRFQPVWKPFTPEERRELVSRTTLGSDTWESLSARLHTASDDSAELVALSAKFRALFTLRPADVERVEPMLSQSRLSGPVFFALFSGVVDAGTDQTDRAMCKLLAMRARQGDPLDDLFVKLAMSPRLPECLPPALLQLRGTTASTQTRHQTGLLASAVLRRLRKEQPLRADSLFATLMGVTQSQTDRLKYLGNYGRCTDLPDVRLSTTSAEREVRAEAFASLRFMDCSESDSLLAQGFRRQRDPLVKRSIVDALAIRKAQPDLVADLLRELAMETGISPLAQAEAELLVRWYPALPPTAQAGVREEIVRIPCKPLKATLESGITGDGRR